MVGTVERQQAGLERDEGQRMARADRATEHLAGVGLNAARHVEREHRAALPVGVIDELRILAGDVACEADAEKAVDHQPPTFLEWQLVRTAGDGDAEELFLQARRRDARVAAVVARSCQDQRVFADAKLCRELRRGGAGALHQRSLAGLLLDLADLVRKVDRLRHDGFYFLVAPISASGSQVASSGKIVTSAMHSTIMKKNGSAASAT